MVSFLAKGLYLFWWTWEYWQFIDRVWWWVIAGVLGGYVLVSLALLFSIANITKAKLAFCIVVNDTENIARRKPEFAGRRTE